MGGHETPGLLVIGHQRKIDHPQEIPLVGRQAQLAALLEQRRAFKADPPENGAGFLPRGGRKEDDVALRHAELPGEFGLFRLAEELHDRRPPFAAFHLDEGEALCAQRLRHLFEPCELALRDVGKPFGVERLHRAAGSGGRGENLEGGLPENLRAIDELEAKPRVRLVDAKTVHRLLEGEPRKRRGQVHSQDILPDLLEHALAQRIDAFAVHKRKLHVDLGEFHLAVGAQILVAEATRDLQVALHARHHQDLLELLRRLRQRVELARMDA